jgi:hypothetical protein
MPTGCSCASYQDLELLRDDIGARIRQTKKLKKGLQRIDRVEGKRDALYECKSCGRLWQESIAWGWDIDDYDRYLFQVPTISVDEWTQLPFVRPHELLVFVAAIERITEGMSERDAPCQAVGCTRRAVTQSVFCLRHHVDSLQEIRSVQRLSGRWFPPYEERGFALQ